MTRLMRAQRPEQKEVRRQMIMEGAARLFATCPYQDLHIATLARLLGLAKGTLYLYFPTKEALFMAVLKEEMDAWFKGAAERLQGTPPGTAPALVAKGLVREMLNRPLLPGLQALVHGVLERNTPPAEAKAFAMFLQEGVDRVGTLLEQAVPGLGRGGGGEFLLRFYGLVIGTRLMSSRPPAVREALQDSSLALFDFTFESLFRNAVVDMLHGMLAQNGRPEPGADG